MNEDTRSDRATTTIPARMKGLRTNGNVASSSNDVMDVSMSRPIPNGNFFAMMTYSQMGISN
jgi:hypothetical protein